MTGRRLPIWAISGSSTMPYRVQDDSVTLPGKGSPKYSGKSVTPRGEERRHKRGSEPGRYDAGTHGHPEKHAGKSTARDTTSVRASAENPIVPEVMPNLR
jgi:hypothetical protein